MTTVKQETFYARYGMTSGGEVHKDQVDTGVDSWTSRHDERRDHGQGKPPVR